MKRVLLIRHGQASLSGPVYDELSALGHRQGQLLGDQLISRWNKPDHWFCGAMKRHGQTLEAIAEGMGYDLKPVVEPGLNEFPAEQLFRHFMPRVLAEDPELDADRLFQDNRVFQKAFAQVVMLWMQADHGDLNGLESWTAFCARSQTALQAVMDTMEAGQSSALVTSAGVIAACVAACDGPLDGRMFQLAWKLVNASVTELHYGDQHWSVQQFNDHQHLSFDPDLVSYR